ncbi:MAG TPA: type I phosphomannose isomerase catalytic subunit [Methylomirabilota bacterium]|nr:type I phosphomannose isomerase catalytic subunit [Methylomirabilota bacterium]
MLYPLTFQPIFKERVWGGRRLETLYQKPLPPDVPIGESWEITDRPEGTSVISNGSLAGRELRWLMEHHGEELLGKQPVPGGRFPWLMKILDAGQKLSLQVHPPAKLAAVLGGEPKTEMWYVAHATPGAELFVGLRRGVTRAEFEQRIRDGTVAECFHRIQVRLGDVMFLPSGRVHALGGGNVIFEIQQNSDTTYRVFDWNRTGLDGRPRELHLRESLASIDFNDFEPGLVTGEDTEEGALRVRRLVNDPLFRVDACELPANAAIHRPERELAVLAVLEGGLTLGHSGQTVSLTPGGFCLLPASLSGVDIRSETGARLLRVRPCGAD